MKLSQIDLTASQKTLKHREKQKAQFKTPVKLNSKLLYGLKNTECSIQSKKGFIGLREVC
jgi:hypothetical protein